MAVATAACPRIFIQILLAIIYHTVCGIFKRDIPSQKIHTSISYMTAGHGSKSMELCVIVFQ